jgi:hypothetical protein
MGIRQLIGPKISAKACPNEHGKRERFQVEFGELKLKNGKILSLAPRQGKNFFKAARFAPLKEF